MADNDFGVDDALPENVRKVFEHLCKEVLMLHATWDLFLGLYDAPEKTAILSETAGWSFNLIQAALLHDMAMTISRLGDPDVSFGFENISLKNLAGRCPDVPKITELLADFQGAFDPVKTYRNKLVGHNDLETRIEPRADPAPGIKKADIDAVIDKAARLLNAVSLHYSQNERAYSFGPMPAFGGAARLLQALRVARDHWSEERERWRHGLP